MGRNGHITSTILGISDLLEFASLISFMFHWVGVILINEREGGVLTFASGGSAIITIRDQCYVGMRDGKEGVRKRFFMVRDGNLLVSRLSLVNQSTSSGGTVEDC